jgi:hypothetical protein
MSLSDFAALSSAASGFAVTVSLIYLAIQTHQNTRNIRAQIQQGAAGRTAAIMLGMMDGDNIVTWIEGNGNQATPERIRQERFALQCGLAVNAVEDHFHQHEAGLQNDEQFRRNIAAMRRLFVQAGMQDFWKVQRAENARVAPRFTSFVDRLCEEAAAV